MIIKLLIKLEKIKVIRRLIIKFTMNLNK